MYFRGFHVVALLLTVITAGVASGAEQDGAANYADWKHRGTIWLLTTPDGANLPAGAVVENFPVLVRLHRDFFDFRQATPRGDDLRFSSGQSLAYQIDQWQPDQGLASIWVLMPKITGNSRQELHVHWGNSAAKSESNGQAVFGESTGYASVWHMSEPVRDEVGTLPSTDTGTTATSGRIGAARHFAGGAGVFCGDKIPNYPSGAGSHSTEAWFRIEKPNATIIGWGNEGGGRGSKVRMQFRSPPHIRIDSDFSDVKGVKRLALGEWTHVVHTYDREDGRIYINGELDAAARPLLNIKSPARLWLGGWYNNYDFVGDLDEVRISRVARSAEWIKLQYENQKPQQSLVGPVVQPGDEFAVSQSQVTLTEGQSTPLTANAGGAQQIYWILKRDGRETTMATGRFTYTLAAGRTVGNQQATLTVKAIYPDRVKASEIPITINEAVPEPAFGLLAPSTWDGRQTIEVVPQMTNLAALQASAAGDLHFAWTVDDVAVVKQEVPGKLLLKRAQGSGTLRVSLAIDNGGTPTIQTATIAVTEPPSSSEHWITRPITATEQPEDHQFFARDYFHHEGKREGTLVYAGTLTDAADEVFVRVFADDKLFATQTAKPTADKAYSLIVKLKPGLVKYRTEFGSSTAGRETILHTTSDLVCGDAFLIIGQSNAVATDFGKENPLVPNDWVRTFGSTNGGPQSRTKLWASALARSPGGKSEIGYWGMELGRRLVESEKMPICIINGAVGGTRIDQHQRNDADPTDVKTIYGRLLWRVQQAGLTHGIRAVLWHQGENDQAADGPTGGYGYETYRQYFVDLAAAWKQDYPNIEHYFAFQIWPRSCAMGINGSDNHLREVQRTLPRLFSNLSVMSTLGVKPIGGCHFPAAGYAEFARHISPLVEQKIYHRDFKQPLTPPNLQRAVFAGDQNDEVVLEFDSPVVWSDALASQFYLDGEAKQVISGTADGNRLRLKLTGPTKATKVTYLDSATWSPDSLLYGQNGLAAFTFCDVPIER